MIIDKWAYCTCNQWDKVWF